MTTFNFMWVTYASQQPCILVNSAVRNNEVTFCVSVVYDELQSAKGEKTTLNTSQSEGGVEDLNADDAFGM